VIVFIAVIALSKIKLDVNLPFDAHLFALANATINSFVSIFLLAALWAVRKRNYVLHKKLMLVAIVLSVLFLVCYIAHHLFTDPTSFGDIDHDGKLSDAEAAQAGSIKTIYYILLLTHIPLAGIILPFILFTAYRALTGEYDRHKKLARFTWPIWFYVAVSGVVVYLMIQPYY
jgi:putative membrane protein